MVNRVIQQAGKSLFKTGNNFPFFFCPLSAMNTKLWCLISARAKIFLLKLAKVCQIVQKNVLCILVQASGSQHFEIFFSFHKQPINFYYQAVYFSFPNQKTTTHPQSKNKKSLDLLFVLYKYFHSMAKWKSRADEGSAFLRVS